MGLFHRVEVGGATLISVQDSWATLPPTAFFDQTEDSDWDNYRDLLNDDGHIVLNLGAWLVISQGTTILVDSGIGGRPAPMPLKEPPALPTVMQEAGVSPDDIDIVAFSHLHFDHTGWNTWDNDGTPVPQFPNARHLIQQTEWDYWTSSDELRQGAGYDNVLAPIVDAGLVDFVEGEHALTSEVITVPTPGHTPGHVSFAVSSGGERGVRARRRRAPPRTAHRDRLVPRGGRQHDRFNRQPAQAVRPDRGRKRADCLRPLHVPRPRPSRPTQRRPLLRG